MSKPLCVLSEPSIANWLSYLFMSCATESYSPVGPPHSGNNFEGSDIFTNFVFTFGSPDELAFSNIL